MRNTNWIIIALALCAIAGLFYFMNQSDFMKEKETTTSEAATSMDFGAEIEENPYGEMEEAWEGNPHNAVEEVWEEENPYGEMEEEVRIPTGVR